MYALVANNSKQHQQQHLLKTKIHQLLLLTCAFILTLSTSAHGATVTAHRKSSAYSKQRVVLISFDGFRHDFVERHNLAAFKRFARHGVRASSLKPAFTTKTFPNHVTMATGLYEETHGIVGNRFYDAQLNATFIKSDDPKWWNNSPAKPLWALNENHVIDESTNKTGKSATIFWPGSTSPYHDKWPFFAFKKYNANYTTRDRFDKIVELLLDNHDLNFVACYMQEPDSVAHNTGPESEATAAMLKKVDADFGYFQRKMDKASLLDKVNIIVVSDHGFSTIPRANVRYLSDYLNSSTLSSFHLDSHGVLLHVRPRDPRNKKLIYEALTQIDHLTVYYKEDIPERWHYKHNSRVPDIVALADPHFYFAPHKGTWEPHGDHGYDNELMDMHGVFMARGPAFKRNLKTGEVQNVDVCPLVCHLLNIPAHVHERMNGSLARVKHLVREENLFSVIAQNPSLVIALLSICGIFVLLVILGCTVSCYKNFVESSKYRKVRTNGADGGMGDDNVPLAQWHDDDEDDVTEYQLRQ